MAGIGPLSDGSEWQPASSSNTRGQRMRDPSNLARAFAIAMLLLIVGRPAYATRTFVSGWDTCDELEFDEGGTASGTTVDTTGKRNGRCSLRVTPADGGGAYHERDLAPSDASVYARVALRNTVAAT